MQVKENHLNDLMTDLVALEGRVKPAWDVIDRVLAMKKNRFVIDGFNLVHQLPNEFIDRYQTSHSVNKRRVLFQFIFLSNLLLFP